MSRFPISCLQVAFTLCAMSRACHAQQVAITFDDLPVHGLIPPGQTRLEIAHKILNTIAADHLPAITGFVNAVRLTDAPISSLGVLEAWREAGQPLANHTFTHMSLDGNTAEAFDAEVVKNEPTLERLAAYPPGHPQSQSWRFLRYPFLQEGNTPEKRAAVRIWLTEHGYRVAEVSLEFSDYLWNAPYARCVAHGDNKAIQRLHDMYLGAAQERIRSQREETRAVFGHEIPYVLLLHIGAFDALMFPELVAQLQAEGFRFLTLPEAEADPAYSTPPSQMTGGGIFEDQVARGKGIGLPQRADYATELAGICN